VDQLHATIEEFAADGYTPHRVLLSAMSRDETEANQSAASHLTGSNNRAALSAASLRPVQELFLAQ
jgi:hypothetical protein